MSLLRFTKHYTSPARAAAAARHYTWLATHATPLRQPLLIADADPTRLTFEHVDGRPARKSDLPRLAALLGDAHGAAWASDLHSARLDRPHSFTDGTPFADFRAPRIKALHARLEQGHLADKGALHAMLTLLERTMDGPCAFYKDCNPRNFIFAVGGTVFSVDTDDLTLAPFGYDLAKLITTLVMTHGPMHPAAIPAALNTYNRAAARHVPHMAGIDRDRLADFFALHSVLSAPYIGRNGYLHEPPVRHPSPTGHR